MPLVVNSGLPSFERLKAEGMSILSKERAADQTIRELHVGLLNMMPDAALTATERQFFRLVGESNPIAQLYVHPFTLPELTRGEKAQDHIERYYENFSDMKDKGLDALIVTGVNVIEPNLENEVFWAPLTEVLAWAEKNVTSTLCSCLATHAAIQSRFGETRKHLNEKCWGVFRHRVINNRHPLVSDINTCFDIPHSRFNVVEREAYTRAGLHVLVESKEAGVHMAVSKDYYSTVYFQGHPEYDTISLLKEYKREIIRFWKGECETYPEFPKHYLSIQSKAILNEFADRVHQHLKNGDDFPEFPEELITEQLENTWHDTGEAIIGNWIGMVYQLTHAERKRPLMDGLDPDNPLGL